MKQFILHSKHFALLLLLGVSMFAPEAKAWRGGIFGFGQQTGIDSNGTYFSPNGYGYGGGIAAEFFSRGRHSLELDGLYGYRMVQTNVSVVSLTRIGTSSTYVQGRRTYKFSFEANYIQANILYRFWIAPAFNIGLGPYYLKYRTVKSTVTDGSTSTTSSAAGLDGGVYGMTASLQARFPTSSKLQMIVEGRYNAGIPKTDRDQEAQAIIGLGFQTKGGK